MEFETISAKDIGKYVGNTDILIIDLRDCKEYKKSHIPNAVNMPYEQLEQQHSTFSKGCTLMLYCERGNISLLASRQLSEQGYRVINICGGIHAYRGKLSID